MVVINALYQGTTFSRADKLSTFRHPERASAREGPAFARAPHPDLGAPSITNVNSVRGKKRPPDGVIAPSFMERY